MKILKYSNLLFGTLFLLNPLSSKAEPQNNRQAVPISKLVQQLKASNQLQNLVPVIQQRLSEVIPDIGMRNLVIKQMNQAIAQGDFSKLDHYPVIPVKQLGKLRALLGEVGTRNQTQATSMTYQGTLESNLGDCTQPASKPSPVNPAVPQLTYGYFPDTSLDECAVDRSTKLADILTSLGKHNGSSVTEGAITAKNPWEMIKALISTGHKVTLLDQRAYADFLSFNWNETEIIWPLWIDTGVVLKNGSPLIVPMGHSQFVFQVEGPVISFARVSFFLGIDGVGFWPDTSQRPAWTGLKTVASVSSESQAGAQKIIDALNISGLYMTRILSESSTIAKGYPAQGYGYLGVCNDSVAIIESLVDIKNVGTPYPLMRAESLNNRPSVGDGLDQILKSLPKDGDEQALNRSSILKRTVAMFPFDKATEASALGNDFVSLMDSAISEDGTL